jgi:hypothetical protein
MDSESMDEDAVKELMRPVKKHLVRLSLRTG